MTTRDEWRAPLNPPGPDWSDRLYRRFREALRVAREDACTRCGGVGAAGGWCAPSSAADRGPRAPSWWTETRVETLREVEARVEARTAAEVGRVLARWAKDNDRLTRELALCRPTTVAGP